MGMIRIRGVVRTLYHGAQPFEEGFDNWRVNVPNVRPTLNKNSTMFDLVQTSGYLVVWHAPAWVKDVDISGHDRSHATPQ